MKTEYDTITETLFRTIHITQSYATVSKGFLEKTLALIEAQKAEIKSLETSNKVLREDLLVAEDELFFTR